MQRSAVDILSKNSKRKYYFSQSVECKKLAETNPKRLASVIALKGFSTQY